jgi:glycosyltransferase involved in cell wall biosynthesis
MNASVVLATRDRRDSLAATLTALAESRPAGNLTWELIVADNGSTDGTSDVLKAVDPRLPAPRRITAPRRGKSRALNAALSVARGEVIAFLDDDVRPEPGWLGAILRPFARRDVSAVTGPVWIAPDLVRPWMRSTHRSWLAETTRSTDGVGANLAIRREVLADVPRFDPELGPGALGLWEDTLFLRQVRSAGHRIVTADDAPAIHHFSSERLDRAAWLRHAAAQGRSEAYVGWHWEHAPDHAALSRELALQVRLLFRRLRRRRDGPAPEWELDLIAGIAFERQWRRERQRRRAYSRHGLVKSA